MRAHSAACCVGPLVLCPLFCAWCMAEGLWTCSCCLEGSHGLCVSATDELQLPPYF